jgi:hypothetical protein
LKKRSVPCRICRCTVKAGIGDTGRGDPGYSLR